MLKNISKVGTVLSKSEQQALHGGENARGCYYQGGMCCQHHTGYVICDAGRCSFGGCEWY